MLFGLPPSSSVAALHDRYLSMAKEWHPDVQGSEEKMQELTAVWSVLRDEKKRAQYDAKLRMQGNQCPKCDGAGTITKTIRFTRVERCFCAACNGTGQAV